MPDNAGSQLAYCMASLRNTLPNEDEDPDDTIKFNYAKLLTKEDMQAEQFPMSPKLIEKCQRKEKRLMKALAKENS